MGSFRTKEDDVAKISTSVFITNFPESCSAKELFQSCKQYGHVVDTFIPTKRSKNGRRFGFVRFINVFNEERLVNNLCTVWIDRFKLHANIARFHRPPLKEKNVIPKKDGGGKSSNSYVFKEHSGFNGGGNSYVHVVKGQNKSGIRESEVPPALVLNDECLLSKDLSKSLLGRVKQFVSLANLRKAVSNEGFVDIKIQYMGELWVLLEFGSEDSMKLFQDNVSIGSWFSQLKQATMEFTNEGRIAWVEVEGIPFKLWTDNTFKRIATKWGELLDIDDQEEMCFHSKRLCIYTKTEKNIFEEFKIIFRGKTSWIRAKETPGWVPDFMEENDDEEQSDVDSKEGEFKVHDTGIYGGDSDVEEARETLFEKSGKKENNLDEEHKDKQEKNSEDPFNIYKLLKKKKDTTENEINSEQTMKYPPGFTPKEGSEEIGMYAEESKSVNFVNLSDHKAEEANKDGHGNCVNKNSKEDVSSSVCSGHFKKSGVPRTGGSILNLMDELVKVGQVMGYKMDGCLAQKAKKDWVKELCVKNKVNFMALQETKMENMELFSVKMCWGNFAFDYVHSDSVGNSGGILCVWDPNSFRKRNATVNDYFVMIRGVWCLTGNDLLIIAVYAPHDCRDKQMLWDYLTYEIGKWKGEVVIMGDFNKVRYKSDRFGSVFNVQGANVFNSFITNAGLEEVPLGGSAFTWCHKSASKMSKLDRFLVSENLIYSCPNINAITLERYLSDHRPILLREASFDYGPTPFRYFHYWNEMEGFNKVVEDAWREGPCDKTNAMLNMMMKLKFLKAKIREWNKSNMLSVKNVKAKYKEELEALEAIIDRGDGNEEIVNKRTEVVNNIQKFDKIHSSEMAQKAKVKWSIEGDENTSFFHGVLNKKRSILNIRGIMVDGNWIESPKAVKGEFFQHFSSRFDKPDASRATINMRYPKTLTYDQQNELESEVSNVEIKRAVWDCGTDKSPGPDGFTFGFYRRFWKIIENDVYDAVKYFFTYGNIPKGCNSSFIALIPKIPDANMVKDFRPISLIGSLYKIIAKILANRLVGVLGDIVNEVQSAFIAERQILDGPFILNEILQWSKTKKKQSLIFKVDFEKAYDSVRWDFLDDILKKFGFGEKWCKWIQSCLRSSRGSILINGSPTEEFQFYKGLKQGDPLSPFLFILIMESLHLSFQRVVDNGMFNGIKLSSSLSISHLFYADDAVFMGQWCDGNISTLIHVLECFYRASGLRINMSKSKILGVNVDSDKVKGAASKLGCLILKTPFTYLGSKVGGSMSRVHAWNEVIDRVKNRLSKWKMKTLSIGGRLTLLKSVLGSIPIFHMSIYRAPLSVLRTLESIRSKFFKGHDINSNKASWVNWKKVLASKEKGGLGVSSLFALNRGLMFKWIWRFYTQNTLLWVRVVKAIHGDDGNVGGHVKSGAKSCWLDIVRETHALKTKGINLLDCMHVKLGNGDKTVFWEDIWIDGKTLKNRFPRIYSLESCKLITDQFNELSALVHDVSLIPMSDRWKWDLESSGDFSVASVRKIIDDKSLSDVDSKTRWIKYVPIKVNVHAWKVKTDSLPTRFNVSRRGIDIDSIMCAICDNGVETSRHLLMDLMERVSLLPKAIVDQHVRLGVSCHRGQTCATGHVELVALVAAACHWVLQENPNAVKREFYNHFRNRFDKPQDQRAMIDMTFPNSLSPEQQSDLECDVTAQELKQAVWDCGLEKSPGPDGFSFGFYRQFWDTIEKDVFKAINHFFTNVDIPKGCNSSFIALIPKIPDANLVKDFRPISLIGSIYKIIAKILTNRLVKVIGDIVSDVQSAFIKWRQILDGPFILNEVIQWCKCKKKHALIFKVDFEKAFDSVRWDFLDDILRKFGFGNKRCEWIQKCLVSSRGSILINGSPTEEFQFFKGLKQGDPLSPFLFILVMECLHISFQKVVDAGTKVGGNMSRTEAWNEVIDKVRSRLSKWKMNTLSIGGRLTLLKSVLGSIPIFHMSIFRVPLGVLQKLESIRRNFFNGHEYDSRKASWVKWSHVLADKDKGGLGVSSLFAINRGLMIKWLWKFYDQKHSFWSKIITAIHGKDGNVDLVRNTRINSCWISILKEVKELRKIGVNVSEWIRLKLGNGESTSFWYDNWSGSGAAKDTFPRLFALENHKEISVRSKLDDSSLDSSFRRTARGGIEQVQFDALVNLVILITVTPKIDRWVWSLEGSGEFSVASIRKVIDANRLKSEHSMTRWVKFVPIKINVLAWKIKMDALPSRFNISRRGIDISSLTCPICDAGIETTDHLFFSCLMAKQITHKIATWWEFDQVDTNNYTDWSSWLASLRLPFNHKVMLEGIFYVMWWNIWTYRNKMIFEDKAPLKSSIFDIVVLNSFHWCKSRSKASFSWNDWLKNPHLITL
ncbi:RNA-directed DNA polymerase, eukaryota [Tanacetum coccineum]|uniref:RNA-directed DNA polymerase, eukaryota n=1 Tax=Tanacetum coccineum TaxID=301880 RepID=A0ABQ5D642_9ASTR